MAWTTMKLSELEIEKMSLSERGLWLQCETMKLEIASLQAENESLRALASLGRKWVDLQNVTAQAIDLCTIMYNKAIVLGILDCVTGKATPLAQLPEKRE